MRFHLIAAGKYHDIDFARLELLKLLAQNAQIRVSVGCDYSNLAALAAADVLITYTCDLVPNAEQTSALDGFLHAGGRWIALHGTNSILRFTDDGKVATPDEAPRFMQLLGTQFQGHPPIGSYQVEITDSDHQMTTGLRDFHIIDELYLTSIVSPIKTLMHTRFTGECPEFVNDQWQADEMPVLYERAIGKGAVLYLTLGHCRGHYDLQPVQAYYPHVERCAWNYPIFYELLRRAIRWSIGPKL